MVRSLIKVSLAFLLIIISSGVFAQSTVSASGAHESNGSLQVSWTLGELMIDTFEPGSVNIAVTTGIHQTDLPVVVTSTSEAFRADVSLYPNPSNQFVNVQFDNPLLNESSYLLFDNQGSLVTSGTLTAEGLRINVSEFAQGFYFLRLKTSFGKSMTFKFLKK